MNIIEYIKELENNFNRYKIEEQKTITVLDNLASIKYNYRLYNEEGICDHNFEFNSKQTYDQLKRAYIKSMIVSLPF